MEDYFIHRKECCFGECQECNARIKSSSSLLQCPVLFDANRLCSWREYDTIISDASFPLKELRNTSGDGLTFKVTFIKKFEIFKKHHFKCKWLQFCRKFDVSTLTCNDVYIQTDYSAQPALESQDKLNCTGHGVCVLSCWLVVHSPKIRTYKDGNGVEHRFKYFECDHVRVVSPAKGKCKDQDWFLHCTILDYLIPMYKTKLTERFSKCILWTDGAPNQYKCRQNFYYVAQCYRKHTVQLIHRFAATAQFKGVHDKIGQVAKWTVQ